MASADFHARKSFKILIAALLALVCALALVGGHVRQAQAATPVAKYGALKVSGTQLVSKKTGKAVQLRGVSTHGLNWDVGYPFNTKAAFKTLRDKYQVNCIRLAMYTTEYFGYCDKGGVWEQTQEQVQKTLRQRVATGVKAASDLGMYVIIDWHVLNDQNPLKYQAQAKKFFAHMAKKYASKRNVIYEICNEPNGGTTWADIKKYAKAVIPQIRKYSPNAVVICGTPTWSQDVEVAAKSPLSFKNVMYAVHFYANTHQDQYRQKVMQARNAGLPIFCSEFSITDASGSGNLNKAQGRKWLDLLDKYKISYVAWSLSNKYESCSLLQPGTQKLSGWEKADLSDAGRWIFSQYRNRS